MKPAIVSIVGTSRPGNFTRHALGVVEDGSRGEEGR